MIEQANQLANWRTLRHKRRNGCNLWGLHGACYNQMIEHAALSATIDFEEFFADRYRSAARFAYLLTGSGQAAEEIAQEAFLQVFRRWAEIHNPEAYLSRALVSGARSWGRKERRRAPGQPSRLVEYDADAIAVRDALSTLPERQREALVLRYFLGCIDREIAEAMGCPVGTVKSLIHRGLARMKEALT